MNNENNNILVDGNESSIHDFDFALICEYFSSVKRQGPGSDEATRKAMATVGDMGENAVVADLGCGCGSQTLQLALGYKARIKVLDLFPLFIEKTMEKCREAGVADRVEGIVGDMNELPFEPESLDLIWSEGAIYNIGFERGMREWHNCLRHGGWIAVSEASWLSDLRPEEIEQFWNEAYPEIDTIYNKVEQMRKTGYRDISTFVLPDDCWTKNFYEPQVEAQRLFLERHPGNATAEGLVANQRHEAELFSRYHDYYGYVFYIGRKE